MNIINKFFKKEDAVSSDKSMMIYEVILDYYLPKIIYILVYASFFGNLATALYYGIILYKLEVGNLIISFLMALSAFGFSKSQKDEHISLILPTILIVSIVKLIQSIQSVGVPYLYIVPIVTFLGLILTLNSPREALKDLANNYLIISKKEEVDYYFLLNNSRKDEKTIKSLIAICHFNDNFKWLEDLFLREDIDINEDFIFHRSLTFCWIDGGKMCELFEKYQFLSPENEKYVDRYLELIRTLNSPYFMFPEVAREQAVKLVSKTNDINQLMEVVEYDYTEIKPIIESAFLESSLKVNSNNNLNHKISKI